MTTTKTTVDFLNDLKARYGLKSNYALAKFMGQTDTAIARWMHGKGSFSDETCAKIAESLDLDPAYVIACIHAEREKNEALKKVWQRIAESMAGVAALLLLAVGIFFPGMFGGDPQTLVFAGFTAPTAFDAVYYVKFAPLPELAIFAVFLAVLSLWLFAFPSNNSPTNDPGKDSGK